MELLLVRHARPETVSGTEVAEPPLCEEGVHEGVEAVVDRHPDGVVAVVGHGGVNRSGKHAIWSVLC